MDAFLYRTHVNYHAPFIYHIILKKKADIEKFGYVVGDSRIAPGHPGSARIEETAIGKVIANAIFKLQSLFPILQIYQFVVMPDHVHILLRVKEWSDKHLDFYIGTLISNIEKKIGSIFLPGYCDKPLLLSRNLDCLFRYIRENPHRLAMRQQFPQFFQHTRKLKIGNGEFEAYGNLFLFRNPDKVAVKISSKFTQKEKEDNIANFIDNASQGSILVSPFISNDEKAIRTQAEAIGTGIILIVHEALGERFKPAAHDFELCSAGRLLIISMGFPAKTSLTRPICIEMNNLASAIAAQ